MTHFDDLWMEAEVTRRQLLASGATTGVVAGFAASVQPVSAQTMIVTPTTTLLEAGMVKIPTADGTIDAYRAVPVSTNPAVVLVIQEIFGLHEHIKDVCRRLALMGYYAIAPSLFDRQGDVTKLASFDEIRPIVARVPDAQVMDDLDRTLAWVRTERAVEIQGLAITGFCWGGRITWLYAAQNPNIKAGIAWYGRVTGDTSPNQPAHPVNVADKIKVPVLGLYGSADAGIPVATLDELKAKLGPDTKSVIHVYPDMPHAFHADYRPSYREAAAKDGWQRMVTWLKQHGVT